MRFPNIAEVVGVQPVVMLTGFLGAGKTTLLREILVAVKEAELVSNVILNDYADAAIDSETLREFAESVEPLTATCACCEGMDFLLDLSVKASKSSADILFIELNGTADPVPIVESFTLLEEKLRLFPRWQVCVIDVGNFGKRDVYSDIEELQLQTASHIYLSHHDGDISSVAAQISDRIREVNPHASILDKETLIESIIALGARKRSIPINASQSKNQEDNKSHLVSKLQSEQHIKTHEVTACKVLMPGHASEDEIKLWLEALGSDVIRAKLLIGVSERPKDRYLYERVGLKVSKYPQKVVLNDSVPNSAILIGPNLDVDKLQRLSDELLPCAQ